MKSEWRRNKTYAMVQTDRFEQDVIKLLRDLYSDAQKDVDQLADEFKRQFAEADNYMRAELAAGNITKERYKQWRKVQMSRGDRWDTMKAQMADRMNKADLQAAAYINDTIPSIYALNHDYTCFTIDQAGVMDGGSFTLVNENAVRELVLGGNHVNFRTVNPNPIRNYDWNAQRIQRIVTLGILSGKSTDKIATDFMSVMKNNRAAAVRNARTAVTSAQNAGTQAAFDQAKDMGIQTKKEWMCTHDSRTRESHAAMDGERVENDDVFSNGLMYPGDPEGEPGEVYNCRCTMRAIMPYMEQMERSGLLQERMYTTWRDRQEIEGQSVIEGNQNNSYEQISSLELLNAEPEYGRISIDENIGSMVPNYENAEVPEAKISRYILDPESNYGKHKARVIESILGYRKEDSEELSRMLLDGVKNNPVSKYEYTDYGSRYTVPIRIHGKKGKSMIQNTVWQIGKGSEIPRFITSKPDMKSIEEE